MKQIRRGIVARHIVAETQNYIKSKDPKCKERIDDSFNILFNEPSYEKPRAWLKGA